MSDLISRQAAIDGIEYELEMINSTLDSITLDFNTRERLYQRRGEAREILNSIQQLPSAQPELIERTAYIRGFEQGRTQGMIDSQAEHTKKGEKNMKAEWTNADALNLQPTCNQLATDCISRRAAVDALIEWYGCKPNDIEAFEEIIEALPSAQPTQNNRVNSNNALDTISRQAAIDALGERPDVWTDSEGELAEARQWEYDVAAIKAVPSAQPERKKGKWRLADIQNPEDKANGNYLYFCSNCFHADLHAKTQEVPYCWYCGAEMKGE